MKKASGTLPFKFIYRSDLSQLPQFAKQVEVNLHGGFAIDDRDGFGHIYFGLPGVGLVRIEPDLKRQELIKLPKDLAYINFHSTKIADINGQRRLILPANNDEKVVILRLEGDLEFVLPRPEFEAYQDPSVPFKPTDVAIVNHKLFVADGYGSNFILSAQIKPPSWNNIFGGETKDRHENGKFGTAHGINLEPSDHHLAIADRWNGRIQIHKQNGNFIQSHMLPKGTWPCGIHYIQFEKQWIAIIGCLYDDISDTSRPGPIYILDAQSYEIISKIQPQLELGIAAAQRIHNVIGCVRNDQFYLICQAWNPGKYFVLQKI